jgi:ATP-dependent DNA helicase RecG
MGQEVLKLLHTDVVIFRRRNVSLLMVSLIYAMQIELLAEHQQSLRSAIQPVYPSTVSNRGITNRTVVKMMEQVYS